MKSETLTTTLLGPNYPPDALAAIEAFRRDVLEEAAQICETTITEWRGSDEAGWSVRRLRKAPEMAAAIRALKEKP